MATASSCGPIKAPEITEASVFETQSSQNENNVKDLIARQELPKLTRSLDFENVKRRLEYLNQSNTVGYIYLLSSNGQLVREGQVAGKVTSLNTFITPMEEIRKIENGYYYGESKYPATYGIVQAPDLDGTYGENVSGVFWFTPDGVYQEWIGPYLFSSERMTFTSEPVLVEARGSK
jgi:hypothetical protein